MDCFPLDTLKSCMCIFRLGSLYPLVKIVLVLSRNLGAAFPIFEKKLDKNANFKKFKQIIGCVLQNG